MSIPHSPDWGVLTDAERERRVVAVYEAVGLPPVRAAEFAAARFPMDADGVLGEVSGRGLDLDAADLTAFLHHRFERDTFADGEPITPDSVCWPRYLVNELVAWCFLQGRGTPTHPAALEAPECLTVAEMLRRLRGRDEVTRVAAGAVLGMSLGAGLGLMGETREDFDCLLLPQLSDLLGRAMAGDGSAADRLESLIVAEPGRAHRPDARAVAS